MAEHDLQSIAFPTLNEAQIAKLSQCLEVTTKAYRDGETLFAVGDRNFKFHIIKAGEVEIVEINEVFGKGTFLGEIGLFTPDGRRTMTVRCKTDVQTAMIDYDQFKQLYFQNPQFGFRLLHLIVARMQHSRELLLPAVPT